MSDETDNRFKYVKAPGVPDFEKLRADGLYPTDERIAQGPIAVFECLQEIPCNPCQEACRQGHIHIGTSITDYPIVNESCTGCGLCLPSCPGLCIFILDGSYSEKEGTVTMPYELVPLPEKGDIVQACNRLGEPVCDGRIIRVRKTARQEVCYAVTVAIPKQWINDVRHIRRKTT